MTDILFLHSLAKYMQTVQASMPATEVTTTIAAMSNRVVGFSSTIGAVGDWDNCVMEFLDGPLEGTRAVIKTSTTNQVTCCDPFSVGAPLVGNSVKLYAGPLKSCRIYMIEPIGAKQAYDEGIRYFVILDTSGGSVESTSFGDDLGFSAVQALVMGCTPFNIGETAGSVDDMLDALYGLPTFRTQLLSIIYSYRRQEAKRVQGKGPIRYKYEGVSIDGLPICKGVALEFTVTLK